MELRRVLIVLLRRWWLVLGLPIVVFFGSIIASANQPYEATVKAVVLLPGDTEETGNAERPELMILDDLPTLIDTAKFANLVEAELDTPANGGTSLTSQDIHDALAAERYNRFLTIVVTRDNQAEALAIGQAVASVLPDAVNQYLIADGETPATVRLTDTPRDAIRNIDDRRLVIIVQTLVALAAGAGLAAFAAALDERVYNENVTAILGMPILADVRGGRRRRFDLRFGRGSRTG